MGEPHGDGSVACSSVSENLLSLGGCCAQERGGEIPPSSAPSQSEVVCELQSDFGKRLGSMPRRRPVAWRQPQGRRRRRRPNLLLEHFT